MHPDPTTIRITREGLLKWTLAFDLQSGKGELWRSADGSNWEQINEDGFDDEYNVGIREMKVFNNSLIASTFNINTGCEVWKYDL